MVDIYLGQWNRIEISEIKSHLTGQLTFDISIWSNNLFNNWHWNNHIQMQRKQTFTSHNT